MAPVRLVMYLVIPPDGNNKIFAVQFQTLYNISVANITNTG